jgi:transcriptional regulator with XRE-family HTH domain
MMDEIDEPATLTAGERLRAAREDKGLGLDDVAAQTRIPRRHLESLETGDWSKLPAPTYTIGFARSYAGVVGLDRAEIADQLRAEMGGQRPATSTAEVFEPADPARSMPKWLVLAAIGAVLLLVLLMTFLRNRSLEDDSPVAEQGAPVASAPGPTAAPPAQLPAASGPVVLTANDQVWLRIRDGATTLKEGVLEAGQSFEIPATAKAPVLTTGKPEALRISVGTADAPVGPPATTVSNVSLLGPDLMRGGGAAAAPAAVPAPAPAPAG